MENLFKFVIFNQITMDKKLLNEAKNKRKTRNILTEKDYRLDIKDFILKIYTNCTPNKYGESFPTKLQVDAGDFLGRIPTYMDRGDLHIKYKKFMEGKISFLDIKGCYSITNIRDWQDFDFFILCFVDHNFKPSFYCVRKSVITNNPKIRLHGMNNVSKINSFNKYVGKRTTIDAKDINFLFKNNNLLKGTSYKNLISFLKNLNNQ